MRQEGGEQPEAASQGTVPTAQAPTLSAASRTVLAGASCNFSVYLRSRELPRREPRNRYPGSMVTI